MEKLTISMAIFNSYVSHYQRVRQTTRISAPPGAAGGRPCSPGGVESPPGAGHKCLVTVCYNPWC